MLTYFNRLGHTDSFDLPQSADNDCDFWLFDRSGPYLDFDQPSSLSLPNEDDKLLSLCGYDSTSVSETRTESKRFSKVDHSEVSSVTSFDCDTLKVNLPFVQTYMSDKEAGNQTSYDQVLLQMVDDESVSFLLKRSVLLDDKLREFIACMLEVMTKTRFEFPSGLPAEVWVEKANKHIKMASLKRKDQKLRMIFNKIVKMLVNRCTSKENKRDTKASKVESFAQKYAGADKQAFQGLIKDCKFPSKKKLKNIFIKYPVFRQELREIIICQTFEKEYFAKRQKKAVRLVSTYVNQQQLNGEQREKTVLVLKDCIKSFPWSVADIATSCSLLLTTIDG